MSKTGAASRALLSVVAAVITYIVADSVLTGQLGAGVIHWLGAVGVAVITLRAWLDTSSADSSDKTDQPPQPVELKQADGKPILTHEVATPTESPNDSVPPVIVPVGTLSTAPLP